VSCIEYHFQLKRKKNYFPSQGEQSIPRFALGQVDAPEHPEQPHEDSPEVNCL
jgi:hypothetical protein